MASCPGVLTSLPSRRGMLQWIEWEMHESLLGSCNRQIIPKGGVASLWTSRELPSLRPLFEASSGDPVIYIGVGTRRSVPVEKVLSSDEKHMSLEVPAEGDIYKFTNH